MKMTDPSRYPSEVFWSDEDEGYVALAPDLPGCSAWGETRADALRELEDAISSWMQAAEAIGNPIPQPSGRRAPSEYSGKLLVRITKQLHADLARQAEKEGVSLNHYIAQALAAACRQDEVLSAVCGGVQGALNVGGVRLLYQATHTLSNAMLLQPGRALRLHNISTTTKVGTRNSNLMVLGEFDKAEINTFDWVEGLNHG